MLFTFGYLFPLQGSEYRGYDIGETDNFDNSSHQVQRGDENEYGDDDERSYSASDRYGANDNYGPSDGYLANDRYGPSDSYEDGDRFQDSVNLRPRDSRRSASDRRRYRNDIRSFSFHEREIYAQEAKAAEEVENYEQRDSATGDYNDYPYDASSATYDARSATYDSRKPRTRGSAPYNGSGDARKQAFRGDNDYNSLPVRQGNGGRYQDLDYGSCDPRGGVQNYQEQEQVERSRTYDARRSRQTDTYNNGRRDGRQRQQHHEDNASSEAAHSERMRRAVSPWRNRRRRSSNEINVQEIANLQEES